MIARELAHLQTDHKSNDKLRIFGSALPPAARCGGSGGAGTVRAGGSASAGAAPHLRLGCTTLPPPPLAPAARLRLRVSERWWAPKGGLFSWTRVRHLVQCVIGWLHCCAAHLSQSSHRGRFFLSWSHHWLLCAAALQSAGGQQGMPFQRHHLPCTLTPSECLPWALG